MKPLHSVCLLGCWIVALGAAAGEPRVVIERDVPATMRDGVVLQADVHRPEGGGPYPVLVWRTPMASTRRSSGNT